MVHSTRAPARNFRLGGWLRMHTLASEASKSEPPRTHISGTHFILKTQTRIKLDTRRRSSTVKFVGFN